MKSNRLLWLAATIIIIIALYFFFRSDKAQDLTSITTLVEKGPFQISVVATGELEAKRSKKILGPSTMQSAQIYETTIQRMIPEGSSVSEGDFVAQLDKTEIANRMSDIQVEVDKINTQLDQAKIDTTIEMRSLRDQMNNIKFSLEETKLQVELNRYEPQAVIRQKNIEYEKTQREFEQIRVKLGLTEEKNYAKIQEIKATLKQQQKKMKRLQDLSKEFTIKAPADGMLIYSRTWNGKVTTGSRVRAWNPVVAELPDLSEMISKTYVNEVDISKISVGQDAIINVDAFPDKSYTGTITQVANIGEQLRDYDTKVFEVLISVNEHDSILRPAMTTGIEVLVNNFDSICYIPIEAIFVDSVEYVYKKQKKNIVKQEVVKGLSNETDILILSGLVEGEKILLNKPENEESLRFEYVPKEKADLAIKAFQREKDKLQAELLEKKRKVKDDIERPKEGSSSFFTIRF
ncbi:MAG: HlyD family efflux transporter periplasmic adaptor subunit [Saprospiraceae bacterium]|nr:efflux RND transporter periplasmic adaptor subunit [Bacteroidia bacterium]NNE13404.1 HlyD family efflux transporter periplasmic adaptor subunit [Saprospiraceae bacterium]NNL93102.1 HlyD family efflux transporter periplasmic adaptor subunit [Saprospiraceae bacterium]